VEQNTDDLAGATTVEEAQSISARLLDEDVLTASERVTTYHGEHCP